MSPALEDGLLPVAQPARCACTWKFVGGACVVVALLCAGVYFYASRAQPSAEQCSDIVDATCVNKGGEVANGKCCFTAAYWGLTKPQLTKLQHDLDTNFPASRTWTMRDFVKEYLRKQFSSERKLGYAMQMNGQDPQKVNVMISHSWDESIMPFFSDVLGAIGDGDVVYICALGIFQGTEREITDQVTDDPYGSPFALAIESAKSANGIMLVVANDHLKSSGGLYSRMWCVWELYLATLQELPVRFVDARSATEDLFGVATFHKMAGVLFAADLSRMGSLEGTCVPKLNVFHKPDPRDEESCGGLQAPGTARCADDDEKKIRYAIMTKPLASASACARMAKCDPFVQLAIVALADACQPQADKTTVIKPCDTHEVLSKCHAVKGIDIAAVIENLCSRDTIFNAMDKQCKLPQPGGWDNDDVNDHLNLTTGYCH